MLTVFAMTPIYQASATLLIESKQAKVVSIEEIYASDVGAKEFRDPAKDPERAADSGKRRG
jgi:succinoglycan biosynthesis transport protein ExoP